METLHPLSSPPILLFPQVLGTSNLLSVAVALPIVDNIYMESHNSWPFVSGFCFPGAQRNEEAKGSSGEGEHILPQPVAPGPALMPGNQRPATLLWATGLAQASALVI